VNLTLNFGESQALEAPAARQPAARNPLVRQDASIERVVEQLEALRQHENSPITAIRRQPAKEAKHVDLPATVNARLAAVLAERGITRLYTHQSEAHDRIVAGENVVIVTPTASGKTLCYNLPVLNALCADPQGCALYLFPTKALAEDQLDDLAGRDRCDGEDAAPSPGRAARHGLGRQRLPALARRCSAARAGGRLGGHVVHRPMSFTRMTLLSPSA
jgi:hypothetical protein